MNFPSQIFSIGGAGKELAFTLLESDWVLRDILEPRPSPQSVSVTIIDTAEGEQNTDRQRIRDIRERVTELENELRDPDQGRTGNLELEYKLITESIQLSGTIDLLGDDAVPRIAAGNGMDEDKWWIEEPHINENLDFAKGVVRKRGLGKAIYYKAYAEDDSISTYIDLPTKGKVAVLCGLGGGTGSGILVDLARHLQQQHRTAEITLFGVLPNHTEGPKENANAFAALTELEYLHLQREEIFKDVVLLPIDPTDFDGKTGNRIQTDKYLNEFDEAAIYLLAAYYNTEGLEDPFADTPSYAPFTIGIPQVLRYNVEAINDAREAIREILDDKEQALRLEEEIYAQIDRFLARHYDDQNVESGLRDLDVADLSERLENVESLLEFDLFNELDYQSLSIFRGIIEDAKAESDDVVEQIEYIAASLRAVDATNQDAGSFVDNIDEHLAEILEQDLRALGQRKEILERRKIIDDSRIRNAIEYLIRSGNTNSAPGVKLQRLEAEVEDKDEKRSRLQSDLEDANAELEALRDEQSEEVQQRLTEWQRATNDDLQALQQHDESAIEDALSELSGQLNRFLNAVTNAASPGEVEQVNRAGVTQSLDRVQSAFEGTNYNFQRDRQAIEASLTQLKNARIAFMNLMQPEGTLEKLTPWESSTEQDRQEANKDYQMQKNKLSDNGIFAIGPPGGQFSASVQFDPQTIIETAHQNRQQLVQQMIDSLRDQLDGLDGERVRSLESALSADPVDVDEVERIAKKAIEDDVVEMGDVEESVREIESELDDVQEQLDLYQPTIELFEDLNNRRDSWSEHSSSFRTNWSEYDDDSRQRVATEEEDYVYIKNIRPDDVFRATGNDNIAQSDFFSSREEHQRVRENLEELSRNARNQEYTGLRRRQLSKDRKRYDNLRIRLSVMSPAISQMDSESIDFENMFNGAFDLGGSGKRSKNPYTSWASEVGGPWDIGLGVFINGVFLDNLRKFVQADGYHNGYENRLSELGDDILVHHSYGLEDGYYVRRTGHLNMEYDDDIEFYLRDEDEIVDDLLSGYYERVEHKQTAAADDD